MLTTGKLMAVAPVNANIDGNNIVTKSNELIQSVISTKHKMTVEDLKIIELIASMVEPNDSQFKTYRVKVSDFMKVLGIKNKGKYSEIKERTALLQEKVFTIVTPERTIQTSWLSSAVYYDREGTVDLRFDPLLKDFFIELKEKFTSYRLKNTIGLKSKYSILIYNILKQYEKIGEIEFSISEIRNLVQLDEDKYKQFGDLKKRILLPAQQEITDKTDINFDFIECKPANRKVTKIKFLINKKRHNKNSNNALINILVDEFKFNELTAFDIINKYDEEYIVKNLEIVRRNMAIGKVNDIPAYTMNAIKKDFAKVKSKNPKQEQDNINYEEQIEDIFLMSAKLLNLDSCAREIQKEVGPLIYIDFISKMKFIEIKENIAYIEVPDTFLECIVTFKYKNVLLQKLNVAGITDIEIKAVNERQDS
jgi:plasmid replication initiation protein